MPYSTMVDCMWKLKIINSCILNYYLCFCGLGLFETKQFHISQNLCSVLIYFLPL